MKNVIILGASGNIAKLVTAMVIKNPDINLTLFLRDKSRLRNNDVSKCRIIEGNVLDFDQLTEAIIGQDIVYVNLTGDLEKMAKNIVRAMQDNGVKRIIFICSVGIYNTPVKSVLIPYRKAADLLEASGLEYTILRPTWFTFANEVDYEITKKGEPERGLVVSQLSLATFIAKMIENPKMHIRENSGINKPNT